MASSYFQEQQERLKKKFANKELKPGALKEAVFGTAASANATGTNMVSDTTSNKSVSIDKNAMVDSQARGMAPDKTPRSQTTAEITRNGVTTSFSQSDLRKRASSVNTVPAEAMKRLTGSSDQPSQQAVSRGDSLRDTLLAKATSGKIGSRAALDALLKYDENAASVATANANAAGKTVANQIAAQRLGLEQQNAEAQRGTEFRKAVFLAGNSRFGSDEELSDRDRLRKFNTLSIANELSAGFGNDPRRIPEAIALAEGLNKVFSESDEGGFTIFSEGDWRPRSLSEIAGIDLIKDGNEAKGIRFTNNAGKTFDTDISIFDVSSTDVANLLNSLNNAGIRVGTTR